MARAKRIIPCLDVTAGRVVKGVNFVELRDAGDPVEIARRYDDQGADELTFLDITATSDQRDLILPIIEAVASQVFIPLTVGGGVRAVADVRRLLEVQLARNVPAEGEAYVAYVDGRPFAHSRVSVPSMNVSTRATTSWKPVSWYARTAGVVIGSSTTKSREVWPKV